MEYLRIDLSKKPLEVGNVLFSIKTSDYYTVTQLGSKIRLEQINGTDVKELSNSTINRWYRLAVGDVPGTETVEETAPAETVEETAPQVEETAPPVEPVAEQEEIEPEIQPAIPTAKKNKKAPNTQTADPVLKQVRENIIQEILKTCPGAVRKETSSYSGLKVGKYNFAEVANGKKRFTIRVIAKALDEELTALCNIAPPSYGWTLDATFTVLTEGDFDTAVKLLTKSYAYRLANTPK